MPSRKLKDGSSSGKARRGAAGKGDQEPPHEVEGNRQRCHKLGADLSVIETKEAGTSTSETFLPSTPTIAPELSTSPSHANKATPSTGRDREKRTIQRALFTDMTQATASELLSDFTADELAVFTNALKRSPAKVKEGGVAVETGPSSSPASDNASDSGSSDDATVGSEPDFFDGGLDALLERSDALPHVTFKSVAAAETAPVPDTAATPCLRRSSRLNKSKSG